MKSNRILSLVLSVCLCATLLVAPVHAATFADVTDPKIQEATDLLYQLGIVNGTGNGNYNPGGFFTRAEFCKMALTAMGRGDEAALHAGRVIFEDVTSGWALGYVNAAATAPNDKTPPLMLGKGNSRFEPTAHITYGEAVTVLMRSLGYSEKDISLTGVWYEGYLNQANAIGLTKNIARKGSEFITRGEAAILFQNLLFTKTKTEDKPFLTAVLGGKITEGELVLSVSATMPDGTKNAVRTSAGTYKPSRGAFAEHYRGSYAKLVLDKNGLLLAIQPDSVGTTRTIRVTAEPEARYLKAANGETILVPPTTPVWQADKEVSTYAKEYMNIKLGANLTLSYNAAGNLSYLYMMGDVQGDAVMVAGSASGNPFAAITGTEPFSVVKNGSPATLADVRQYDVGSYSLTNGVLTVSDRRLTGVYANAAPSPASPSTVTVMGHPFPVLDCALKDLATFNVGSPITLLLTEDGKIAGAVKPTVLSSTAIGVATITGTGDEKIATVTLTTGIEVSGAVSMGDQSAKTISGKLVEVSSSKIGELTLKTLVGSGADGAWNIAKGTVGTLKLSDGAAIYERIGTSRLYPVKKSDVSIASVPTKSITYVGTNFKGEADLLVLENVTGDHLAYGLADFTPATGSADNPWSYSNAIISVKNGGKDHPTLITGTDLSAESKKGVPIGIATSLETVDGKPKLGSWISLSKTEDVRRSAFSDKSVTVNGKEFPFDPNLDAQCYNKTTKTWFESLDAAKAYATRLTVYYDRPANEGGKIRLVIVA